MTTAKKLISAAGAAGGSATYVDDVFSTFLYEGTGSNQTITNNIDLNGEGGLVWIKRRSTTRDHGLFDTERGVNQRLYSNLTLASGTNTSSLTAFNSNGFTVGTESDVNGSSETNVAWTFRKAPKFFDVVTYTGDTSSAKQISHNLGSTPGSIFIKRTDDSTSWIVYHKDIPGNNGTGVGYLTLNTDDNNGVNANAFPTQPTDTHFTVNANYGGMNGSGATYVAYLFAHDAQDFGTDSDEAIIKCGGYTGDGTAGKEINLGFEPQWLMIKKTSGTGSWELIDSMRGIISGGNDAFLRADTSGQEFATSYDYADLTATGFKLSNDSNVNGNSATYVYIAIRRPHKPVSEFAATDLFSLSMGLNASTGGKAYATTYPVDFHFAKNNINGTGDWYVRDRLRGGGNYLNFNDPRAQSSHAYNNEFDHMDGIYSQTALNSTGSIGYQFRRAPGYFDVVSYKGTGSFTWFNHNLGVVPEMIIFKSRDYAEHWNVFTTGQGTSSRLRLNEGDEARTNDQNQFWTNLPTATQFRIGNNNEINGSSYNYVAYLFASVAGISKLGTYTGTGSAQNIDCGFSAGARFVLIKRVDVAGFWMVWDSVRGIVAGNDPYLFINTNAGQNSSYDYIDPLSSGFTITSSAPTDNSDTSMNKSGGTYFFYAIA